jgi:hypothetical protein
MSRRNPDYVYSTAIESASSKITYAVQSTNNTERRGGMVGGEKPSGHEVKLGILLTHFRPFEKGK